MLNIRNYNNKSNIHFKSRVGLPKGFSIEIQSAICNNEIPNYFVPTPKKITKLMINEIGPIKNSERLLEPSAGYGHIIDELLLRNIVSKTNIDAIEPIDLLREKLRTKGVNIVGLNILNYNPGAIYDKILMNPPFYNGQDILHVLHCYKLLKPGGKLATVLPNSAFIPPKQIGYEKWQKDWLNDGRYMEINEYLQELINKPEVSSKKINLKQAFMQSDVPDNISTNLLILEKPKDNFLYY